MSILGWILLSTFLVSLGGFAGLVTLVVNYEKVEKVLLGLVALSAGALMGGAFLHLLPEALVEIETEAGFEFVLIAFVTFFIIEKVFHWRHCHKDDCEIHTFGYMNLVGDSLHNFIDGLVLAAAFTTDVRLGLTATLAVSMHEIPQEIGDFGVLLYAGFGKVRALLLNFAVALLAMAGGVVGYWFATAVEKNSAYLLAFAAGGFIYIGAADLLPEIKKEKSGLKSMLWLIAFVLGIGMMWLLKFMGE